MGQIISQNKLAKIRQALRQQGKTVVFTNGCFDIIHRGHVEYLSKAKKLGDVLIIGLNSDSSVRKLKGAGRPVVKLPDRAIVLSHLDMVDYVTVFGTATPKNLIAKLLPDILVKGGDYKIADVIGANEVISARGKAITIPFIKGRSTSKIYDTILSL